MKTSIMTGLLLLAAIIGSAAPRVLVLPFVIDPANGQDISVLPFIAGAEKEFHARLVTALAATGKLELIDNGEASKLLADQGLTVNSNSPVSQLSRAGSAVSADYLVAGNVRQMLMISQRIDDINSGRRTDLIAAKAALRFRIMNVRTGKIIVAEEFRKMVNPELIPAQEPQVTVPAAFKDELLKKICTATGNAILSGIWPVRVVSTKDYQVIVNRGEGYGLQVGQHLDVFAPGAEMVDPVSREALGSPDNKIAELEVVSVTPTFSITRLCLPPGATEDHARAAMLLIRPGQICRPSVPVNYDDILINNQ